MYPAIRGFIIKFYIIKYSWDEAVLSPDKLAGCSWGLGCHTHGCTIYAVCVSGPCRLHASFKALDAGAEYTPTQSRA
eukprot:3214012-Prymnesium_polylepis.1